ncbi:MAG: phosphoribosylanthranilate isomerase [Alphaproteobacteria bacterium]|jgi:phosphoribosylanthranilate isomerase
MALNIKICGVNSAEIFDFLEENKVSYAGFIFYKKSIRYFDYEKNKIFSKNYKIKKVGVFVNSPLDEIKQVYDTFPFDLIQLHGNETEGQLIEIKNYFKLPIIRAYQIQTAKDLEGITTKADYLLFDSHSANYGGSGKTFDWKILENFKSQKPWFLSGGLNASNVRQALKKVNTTYLDVSSSLEENKDGKKSKKLIAEFLKAVNQK